MIAEYERRRDLVYEELTRMPGVVVRRPEGAFYICPGSRGRRPELLRVPAAAISIGGETVMLAPAEGFYATPGLGRDEARIAYVL